MRHYFLVVYLILIALMMPDRSWSQSLQAPEIQIEQIAQDRALKILSKVDPNAIVQVRVTLKQISARLPGVQFDARVVPKGAQGETIRDSVSEVNVRVITENQRIPDWVKAEVVEALRFGAAKVNVAYIARTGFNQVANPMTQLPQLMDKFSRDLTTGISSGMSTSMSNAFSGQFSQNLEKSLTNSMTQSLSATLPNAMSNAMSTSMTNAFSNQFSQSLEKSLTNSLTNSLNSSLPNALSKVGQPAAAAKDPNSGLTASSLQDIKLGLWGVSAAVILAILILAAAVFGLGGKIEFALARAIETKLAPLLEGGVGGGSSAAGISSTGEDDEDEIGGQVIAGTGGESSNRAVTDLPMEALLNLFADCYWTKQDAYAHFLWTEMSQKQRTEFLGLTEVKQLYLSYLSYIRQFAPVNANHHTDARYLNAIAQFRFMSQQDLAAWIMQNQPYLLRLTPLRWENLPISLVDRINFTMSMSNGSLGDASQLDASKVVVSHRSPPRELPMPLKVKSISIEDEVFLWTNSQQIPSYMRASLPTLVWLASCPIEVRKTVLADYNARDLAEAWIGPDEVLSAIGEALPSKKLNMLQSYMKETKPSRRSDVYLALVQAGLEGLSTSEGGSDSESADGYDSRTDEAA